MLTRPRFRALTAGNPVPRSERYRAMSKTISITSSDGRAFDAELALPPSGPAPAIVVVPSIFGITDAFKAKLDGLASKGFIVICPDPFWRTHPGPLTGANVPEAQARKNAYELEPGLDDLRRTIGVLGTMPEWNGTFGIFGYCFGGIHAFLGITRLGAEAGASFHGTMIHTVLDEADRCTKPFSFHYGVNDHVVPLEQVEQIRTALAGKDGEIYVYESAGHSFALADNPSYNPEVAALSEARALAIFDRLKTPVIA
jgi:carboxymethylenebutenolidase